MYFLQFKNICLLFNTFVSLNLYLVERFVREIDTQKINVVITWEQLPGKKLIGIN